MLKINQKQQLYTPNLNSMKQGKSKKMGQPSFTSCASKITKAEEIILENSLIKNHLGTFGKALLKLSETAGEIQNILFIGFGTAFVAPIFIAYNKLAKEDERTKKYSALRQPISAVITVVTGLGINYPIANWFNKASAEGRLSKFDMTAKPPSDLVKNSFNNITKQLKKHGADGIKNLKPFDKKMFDYCNDGSIDSLEKFQEAFSNAQKFEKKVHESSSLAAAEKMLDINNPKSLHKMSLKDYLIENLDFEADHHDKNALNPDSSKTKFSEISALKFLKKFGVYDGGSPFKESTVRTLIAKEIYKTQFEQEYSANKEQSEQFFSILEQTVKDNPYKPVTAQELMNACKAQLPKVGFTERETKKIARIAELYTTEDVRNLEKISAKQLFKALGVEKDIYLKPEMYNMKMPEFLIWLNDKTNKNESVKFGELPIDDRAVVAKLKKMVSRIAQEKANSASSALKAYSKVQGIVLSLAILPFACGVLNWSYPRIMEKFFPSLVGDKVEKKGENK